MTPIPMRFPIVMSSQSVVSKQSNRRNTQLLPNSQRTQTTTRLPCFFALGRE